MVNNMDHGLPKFSLLGYDDWKIMMEAHLYALHDCMWMVLEDGPLKIQMENPERNPAAPDVVQYIPKPKEKWDDRDWKKHNLDNVAKALIFKTLDPITFSKIKHLKTAMEIWQSLGKLCEGSEDLRKQKIEVLLEKFKSFKMLPGESFDMLDERFHKILNDLASLNHILSPKEKNVRLLRLLPTELYTKATTMEEGRNLENYTFQVSTGMAKDQSRKGSFDDCLHNHSPEKGLAMLIEEIHYTNMQEMVPDTRDYGYHSEDGKSSDILDQSTLRHPRVIEPIVSADQIHFYNNPKTFNDYRPISLSTFMSKINTRILADRIHLLLSKMISPEQTGFQKGMGVDEQILLVEEMVHKLDYKVRGDNVILKIDMAKAFDKLEWQYIQGVLGKVGFSSQAQHLLMANINSTYLSLLINGSPRGFFKMKRGVKQGDPLSPLLFIIASEGLSRALKFYMSTGYITNFNTGGGKLISHLAYAVDVIIFCNSQSNNLIKVKEILKKYQEASGQEINYNKSRFYCGKGVNTYTTLQMERILGMKKGTLRFKYLGTPICKGMLKKGDCGDLITHFSNYIEKWYSKTLSQMGRLILIKHVLCTIPLHYMAVHSLPKSVINKLQQMMTTFFWGHTNNKKRYHWTKWENICLPKEEGGLGIRDLEELQFAYSIKLWWNFRFNNNNCAQFMRAKYSTQNFSEKLTDSPIRKRICRINDSAEEFMGDITPYREDEDEI
ncbi:unnamed protein product [Cuscuta campestris]|uniref:Reverse transcriptase domain-containing protein n=1 Tax=Cuscuta campestris TaxID=132261 RepID=A0A484NDI4_9ASTE|nr:unnamed protein product [Cuscuta campestris]